MEVKSRKKVYLSGKCGSSVQIKTAKLTQDIHDTIEALGNQLAINSKPILTLEEACIYLGVSKYTLDRSASENTIAYYKPQNKRRYFLKEDLNNFVMNKEGRVKSRDEIESEASLWSARDK